VGKDFPVRTQVKKARRDTLCGISRTFLTEDKAGAGFSPAVIDFLDQTRVYRGNSGQGYPTTYDFLGLEPILFPGSIKIGHRDAKLVLRTQNANRVDLNSSTTGKKSQCSKGFKNLSIRSTQFKDHV